MRLPSTYKPGEVDEEVYRPSAPLPPWDSDKPEDQNAFLEWAAEALDEFDPPRVTAELKRMESEHSVRLLRQEYDEPLFEKLKRDYLPYLSWRGFCAARFGPMPRKPAEKPGRKADERITAAVADYAHLSELFRRHYGRVQRRKPPSRETILRKRYGLNDDEWEKAYAEIKKARL